MVLTGRREGSVPSAAELAVIWHDLECGGYRADLPLWLELAEGFADGRPADPILEIGAGSGRVSVELARAGHRVTAVDLDRQLLDALSSRAAGSTVEVVCADARKLDLAQKDFGLCIVAMQTVQLFEGNAGRLAFLRRARAHLRPGGVLALAIVSEFECFDCTRGGNGPSAETVRLDGTDYVSRPLRVSIDHDRATIERARRILPRGREVTRAGSSRLLHIGARSATTAGERNVIELDLLTAEQLEREGAAAGLHPLPKMRIDATAEHLGSDVVMLGA
jgi:SAM-dependent methyltransferase